MNNYFIEISGWLKASGNTLMDTLQQGSRLCRVVPIEPEKYLTGYISTAGGSFKLSGQNGNWYGTSFGVSEAEVRPTGTPIYEYSQLKQDTPVWNMHKLPNQFLSAIQADRNLESGKFFKSQFVVECLPAKSTASGVSGIYFPSRQTEGGVAIFNPHAVSLEIIYTGQAAPETKQIYPHMWG